MDEDKKSSVSSITVWGGAEATCLQYIAKIEALAIYQGCKEALDATEMAGCPTKAAYAAIDKATADLGLKKLLSLYRQNAKIVATIMLGQASDYGMAVIDKTKTTDNAGSRQICS